MRKVSWLSVFIFLVFSVAAQAAIIDTYFEDFDDRQDDATINEVDSWTLDQGVATNAITQNSSTYTGTGKALQLSGATPATNIARSATYGDLSPCWIEYVVKPGIGSQRRDVPTGKITALSFDYSGKIYAADGSSWTDTGETFTEGEWYRVILRLDFETHLYNILIEPMTVENIPFIPDKENLNFIDSSINSLSNVCFEGVYNSARTDETYIDDLVIHFVDRLEIITPSQTLIENQVSNPITVQLQSSYSEPQTAWRDITLELRSSSENGEFSLDKDNWKPISQVVILEEAQGTTFYYKDSKMGKPIITAKEYLDRGWEEASQQERIISRAPYFDVSVTTPQVAGRDFTIEIIARDDEGEVDESYTGEVEILTSYVSPGTGTMKITPEAVSGFDEGRTEVVAQYPDCGIIEIMVQDDTESPPKIGVSGEILFVPSEFSVSAETPQIVNKAFQLGVSALNTEAQLCPNYQGPAGLSVVPISPLETDGKVLPTTIDVGGFSEGLAEVTASFDRWGMIYIEAYDVNYPEQRGRSDLVIFQPSGLLVEAEPPSSDRDFYYIGESIRISISAIDELNAPIPNYEGLVNISSTLGLFLPEQYQFLEIDEGMHAFFTSVSSPGFYEISAEDEASQLKAETVSVEVKKATLKVVSTFAPVGTAEVVIKLVDEEGNIITSENDLTITVELEEELENSSASSGAVSTPVTLKNGVAKILVSDAQPEIVTVSPSSIFDFETKKGTITFGRISKTGIGTLLWREIKE